MEQRKDFAKYLVFAFLVVFLILAKDCFQPLPEILVYRSLKLSQINFSNSSSELGESQVVEDYDIPLERGRRSAADEEIDDTQKKDSNVNESKEVKEVKKKKRQKSSKKKKKAPKKNKMIEDNVEYSESAAPKVLEQPEDDGGNQNPFSKDVLQYLGRNRISATLGSFRDFSTSVIDSGNDFEITMEKFEITEELKEFQFRGDKKLRSLSAKVKRWPHKEGLDSSYPDECGFPVCSIIDSRPKRFKSLCHLMAYLKDEGKARRVVEVQKGGCEDAIEGIGHDRPWASQKASSCSKCKEHKHCGLQLCINDNGHAKTFTDVCSAMQYLHDKTKVVVVAVGLGDCKALYSSCLYTEWWDLDEPCSKGEVEAVIIAHTYAMSLGQQGRHRSCSASRINYPAEILTLEGQSKVVGEGNHYVIDKDKIVCLNSNNKDKPKPPYYWANKEVTCRDWKLRYCCQNMWGEAVAVTSISQVKSNESVKYTETDVIVDAPFIKTLFDGCEWKDFKSVSTGQGGGDLESRELNSKYAMPSVCKMDKFAAFFIDTRTVADDVPWDETGTVITKNTAIYGFYCDNKNNQHLDKRCENYKVRFCCKIEKASEWGQWSEWSSCTKTCGGGVHKRTRVCDKKEGRKDTCFMDNPGGDIRYREMKESCNELPCPKDLQWQEWQAWSSCSATCGKGTRIRRRACFPPKNGGKDCPSYDHKSYTVIGKCTLRNCVDAQWTPWTSWSACSVSCGLGTKTRRRSCVDIANGKTPIPSGSPDMCLGPPIHQNDCLEKKCPVDGGLTLWQNWGECSLACGPEGYRKRMRYCTNPFPMHGGKDCRGNLEEKGPCKIMPECPIHCFFSEWGSWSKCSHSCGNSQGAGTRIRNRYIAVEAKHGGMKCYGNLKELDSCIHCAKKPKGYDGPCINFCPVDCVWSKWTSWTGTCRSCYHKGQEKQAELLSRTRQRFVERDAEYGGKECHTESGKIHKVNDGLETQKHQCRLQIDTPPCPEKEEEPYWSAWESWADCTSLCGKKGYEVRKRKCISGQQSKGKTSCPGKSEESRLCISPCPSEGWTEWDMWSPCQVTCGVGQSARRRTCQEDNKKDIPEDKKTCKGIERAVRPCDSGSCTKYESFETAGKDVTGLVTGWRDTSSKFRPRKNFNSTEITTPRQNLATQYEQNQTKESDEKSETKETTKKYEKNKDEGENYEKTVDGSEKYESKEKIGTPRLELKEDSATGNSNETDTNKKEGSTKEEPKTDGPYIKDDSGKEESKKSEPDKKDEPEKEEPKKLDHDKKDSTKEEPKTGGSYVKDDSGKEESKKSEPEKKDEPEKEEPKKSDTLKKDDSAKEEPKNDDDAKQEPKAAGLDEKESKTDGKSDPAKEELKKSVPDVKDTSSKKDSKELSSDDKENEAQEKRVEIPEEQKDSDDSTKATKETENVKESPDGKEDSKPKPRSTLNETKNTEEPTEGSKDSNSGAKDDSSDPKGGENQKDETTLAPQEAKDVQAKNESLVEKQEKARMSDDDSKDQTSSNKTDETSNEKQSPEESSNSTKTGSVESKISNETVENNATKTEEIAKQSSNDTQESNNTTMTDSGSIKNQDLGEQVMETREKGIGVKENEPVENDEKDESHLKTLPETKVSDRGRGRKSKDDDEGDAKAPRINADPEVVGKSQKDRDNGKKYENGIEKQDQEEALKERYENKDYDYEDERKSQMNDEKDYPKLRSEDFENSTGPHRNKYGKQDKEKAEDDSEKRNQLKKKMDVDASEAYQVTNPNDLES